jgi:dTDP-glucose 4,6-dehydratase
MKMLVTGGAGFIGCNFVRLAAALGYDITVIDKLTYAGSLRNLDDVKSRIKFFKGDIGSDHDVSAAMEGVDTVVNFAAETHVDRSIKDPLPFIETNVLGTHVILNEARKHDIKKFVHISTDEVYGSINHGVFKEGDTLDPKNPYSATKAAAEHLVLSYVNTYGMKATVTRSSNNYGPYQNPEKFIPKIITNAMQDKPIPVYGNGTNIRDWIYVEDNCSGIIAVVENGATGEIYNIGGGQEKTNIDVVKTILNIMGKPETLIHFISDRPGHDFRYALDSSKVKRLGWKPHYDFEAGLRKEIDWYMKNSWFWQ